MGAAVRAVKGGRTSCRLFTAMQQHELTSTDLVMATRARTHGSTTIDVMMQVLESLERTSCRIGGFKLALTLTLFRYDLAIPVKRLGTSSLKMRVRASTSFSVLPALPGIRQIPSPPARCLSPGLLKSRSSRDKGQGNNSR